MCFVGPEESEREKRGFGEVSFMRAIKSAAAFVGSRRGFGALSYVCLWFIRLPQMQSRGALLKDSRRFMSLDR